MSTPETV